MSWARAIAAALVMSSLLIPVTEFAFRHVSVIRRPAEEAEDLALLNPGRVQQFASTARLDRANLKGRLHETDPARLGRLYAFCGLRVGPDRRADGGNSPR